MDMTLCSTTNLKLAAVVVFLLVLPGALRAATYQAASCAESDVQAAVNKTVDGDTVVVPGCPQGVNWTTYLYLPKQITLMGSGQGATVINDGANGTLISVGMTSSATLTTPFDSAPFRISGFTFTGNAGASGIIYVHGTSQGFRIDHVTFSGVSGSWVVAIGGDGDGGAWGVLDHDTWSNTHATGFNVLYPLWNAPNYPAWQSNHTYATGAVIQDGNGQTEYASQGGISGALPPSWSVIGGSVTDGTSPNQITWWNMNIAGDVSWASPINLGSENQVYAEDDTFNPSSSLYTFSDGEDGARFVVRHDYGVTSAYNHGTESAGRERGTVDMEVYDNQFSVPSGAASVDPPGTWRSGTGVFFGNTIAGSVYSTSTQGMLGLINQRDTDSLKPWGPSSNGYQAGCWGDDGTGIDPYDVNTTPTPIPTGTEASYAGTGYTTGTAVATSAITGSGSGLTLNTTVTSGGVSAAAINAAGSGYAVNDIAEITGGGLVPPLNYYDSAVVTITSIGTGGSVTGISGPEGLDWLNAAGTPFSGKTYDNGMTLYNSTRHWGSVIVASTASTILTSPPEQHGINPFHIWAGGDTYEIISAYPCMDQPGRADGTMVYGGNATTGGSPAAPANEQLSPIYAWNNTLNGTANPACAPNGGHPCAPRSADNTQELHIKINRDYYTEGDDLPSTSTPGVQTGTYAAMQSAGCSFVGAAWWATDTDTLYQCTATNTWTAYYTPLVYPHPLVEMDPCTATPDRPTGSCGRGQGVATLGN